MTILNKTLVKTDRNGTKYYDVERTCDKCGGTGYIDGYRHVQGGACFDCGGTGRLFGTEKEYTPEYAIALEKRRVAAVVKRAELRDSRRAAQVKSEYESYGDVVYVVLGRRSLGGFQGTETDYAFLTNVVGCSWRGHAMLCQDMRFNEERYCGDDPFAFVAVPKDMLFQGADGSRPMEYVDDIGKLSREMCKYGPELPEGLKHVSEHLYGEGESVELELRLDFRHEYKSSFGYNRTSYIYVMSDQAGNVYKWFSDTIQGWHGFVMVKARVKSLGEYNGVKETTLTRCKVQPV